MRSSQGRFRADLEFVHDSDTAPTDSKVTIVDPRSGMRHTFTADEYMVCRAIDGTTTLAAARQAFKAETGREIAHSKLAAFFRRLRSLGLIEEDKSTVEIVPGSGEPDSTSMAEDGRRDVVTLERGRVDAVAKQPAMNTSGAGAAGIAQPTPPRAEGTAAASAGPELVTQSGPGAEPLLPAPSDPDAADFRNKLQARLQRAMHSGRRASNSRSPRGSANVAPASTAEAKKLDLPAAATPGKPDASQGFTEGSEELEFLGPEAGETESPAARPSDLRGKRRRAGRSKAGAARTARAAVRGPGDTGGPVGAGEQGDFDDLEAALDEMEPDGLRPMLGGGLGGYRLGGGNAQNLLAGLAARARARRGSESDEKEPARISLFNPNAILGVIAALSRPLKYLFVPLLLLAPTTVWIAYQYRNILAQDIRGFDESAVATVILGLVITDLICRLTQATLIRAFGGSVKQFGIALTFGLPHFFVDLGGIATLGRRGQLWVYAASLIARIGLFCGGTLLWFALRLSSPLLAHLALVVGQIGLLTLLLSTLPLLPGSGYCWLATYFGRPKLRSDTLRAIRGGASEAAGDEALRGMPTLDDVDIDAAISESSAVTLYVLGLALGVSMLALVAQTYFDVATTGNVGLLTAALLFGVGIAFAAWIIALRKYVRGAEIEVLDSAATKQLLTNWIGQADVSSERSVSIGTVGKLFWAVVLCVLLAVAFLPYRYAAGGKFEILPAERTVVSVGTSGELKQVLVHDGEWVKANQVLAKLSSDDQERAISITNAELQHARAQLAQFGGGSTTSADSALEQSIGDALGDDPGSASAKKAQTGANYTRTQAERVARTEVERLTRKLAFERDQLRQTDVRAPKEGRVVTPEFRLWTGIWLRRGAKLLVLADTRVLEAEVYIPETDIAGVKVGDKVRLRPWSNDDREIAGTVTEISPTAQPTSYGRVVRVRVSIGNSENVLRPGMTGYAKIDGEDMRVWEAFLGRIIRIVRVEMWSWIP